MGTENTLVSPGRSRDEINLKAAKAYFVPLGVVGCEVEDSADVAIEAVAISSLADQPVPFALPALQLSLAENGRNACVR